MNNHKSTEEAKNAILERIAVKLATNEENEVIAGHAAHYSHVAAHGSSSHKHGSSRAAHSSRSTHSARSHMSTSRGR